MQFCLSPLNISLKPVKCQDTVLGVFGFPFGGLSVLVQESQTGWVINVSPKWCQLVVALTFGAGLSLTRHARVTAKQVVKMYLLQTPHCLFLLTTSCVRGTKEQHAGQRADHSWENSVLRRREKPSSDWSFKKLLVEAISAEGGWP